MKAKAESMAVVKGNYSFPAYRSALAETARKMCK
jgi:hypothetical protein